VEWTNDGYVICNDPERVDRDAVWSFLRTSYWAAGVEREIVDRAIDNSLVFGMRAADGSQAGFARAVTDRARMAWVGDLFVLPAHRGRGLGVWLTQTIVQHPALVPLRLILATADAHGLYERFGFVTTGGGRFMERPRPQEVG
jgi:GNAT superfamily N-acetyltransferase